MEQQTSSQTNAAGFIKTVHGIRYQVTDVARAVAFYTQHLGFTLKHQQLPALPAFPWETRTSFRAVPEHLDRGRCRMVSIRHQVGGTVWC